MFERFTDRARQTVIRAQEEAKALGHNYIGTEHLLLGLLNDRSGDIPQKALGNCGITLDGVRTQVAEVIGTATEWQNREHIPFTPRAKKCLDFAMKEALRLSHSYIAPEHILLGLLREGEGVGTIAIKNLGGELDQVRREVLAVLIGMGLRIPESMKQPPARPRTVILAEIEQHATAILLLTRELNQQ